MFSSDPFSPNLTEDQYDKAARLLRPALLEQALLQCRRDDAEDCVCEAVELGLFNLARFQVRGEYHGARGFVPALDWRSDLAFWLRHILANVLRSFFRKETRRSEVVFAELPACSNSEGQEALEKAESLALHDELYRRLGEVSLTSLQAACIRRWMGGQTHKEIGEDLGISARMVGYHIEAAAKRMRKGGDLEISKDMWLLFVDCAFHARYTKPSGIWPDWMMQHPPDINLSAWVRRGEKRRKQAERRIAA